MSLSSFKHTKINLVMFQNLTLAVIKAKFTDNQSNNRPVIEEVEVEMKCDLFLLKTYHKK